MANGTMDPCPGKAAEAGAGVRVPGDDSRPGRGGQVGAIGCRGGRATGRDCHWGGAAGGQGGRNTTHSKMSDIDHDGGNKKYIKALQYNN